MHLIDSGMNTPDARKLAEGLTDLPIILINTHGEDYEIKNLNQRNPGKSRVWGLRSVSLTSTDAA